MSARGAGSDDLLACREQVGVHILAAEALFFIRGRFDDRGRAPPQDRHGGPEKLHGQPRTERSRVRVLPYAGLRAAAAAEGHCIAKAVLARSRQCRGLWSFGPNSDAVDQLGFDPATV